MTIQALVCISYTSSLVVKNTLVQEVDAQRLQRHGHAAVVSAQLVQTAPFSDVSVCFITLRKRSINVLGMLSLMIA